ncbi:hypothetical protein DFH29DRAFT_879680 [Suillus ampliporus]|nr:hypothetical protein DFH29DRAFT_879680 [Suillus ampliporus]
MTFTVVYKNDYLHSSMERDYRDSGTLAANGGCSRTNSAYIVQGIILHRNVSLQVEALQIEAPYQAPSKLTDEEESANIVLGVFDKFNSIGEFYTKLELRHVGVEEAHYQMFLDLYMKRAEWTCQPVPNSPKTEMYKENKLVYEVRIRIVHSLYVLETNESLAGACIKYSLLLPACHDSEDMARSDRQNIHSIMIDIMTPLTEFMVEEPFGDVKAAPLFQFYLTDTGEDPSKVDEAANELREAIKHLEHVINGVNDAEKEVFNVIKFSVHCVL